MVYITAICAVAMHLVGRSTADLANNAGLHVGKKRSATHHFKSCRNSTWPFIKTLESDVKVV